MKKPHFSVLIAVTLLFSGFLLGFLAGRNDRGDVIVSVPPVMRTEPTQSLPSTEATEAATEAIAFPIDINSATQEELMALPGIGEVLAKRILSYREQNGSFSHVTELMNVEGIGQTRMEEILDCITTGG